MIATLFLGAILGSTSIRFVADKLGRKKGLLLAIFMSEVFVVLSMLSEFVRMIYRC